jgi:hypothetical protein
MMRFTGPISCMMLACLLAGCSTQLLEDANEIVIPRDCREPTALFTNFVMRAKNVTWSEPKAAKDKTPTLTLQLAFENATKWSVALSNSDNGILYSIEYSLSGEDGVRYAPTEIGGVAKEIHQPIRPGETLEGALTFNVPRANYVLTLERKFAGKSVPAKREDYLSACKIPSRDFSIARPSGLKGLLGVY